MGWDLARARSVQIWPGTEIGRSGIGWGSEFDNSRCTKRQIMRVEILCSETSHIIHHWKDLNEGC